MKPIKLFLLAIVAVLLALPAWADPPEWVSPFGPGLNQSDDDCDLVPLGFTFNYKEFYSQ